MIFKEWHESHILLYIQFKYLDKAPCGQTLFELEVCAITLVYSTLNTSNSTSPGHLVQPQHLPIQCHVKLNQQDINCIRFYLQIFYSWKRFEHLSKLCEGAEKEISHRSGIALNWIAKELPANRISPQNFFFLIKSLHSKYYSVRNVCFTTGKTLYWQTFLW